MVIKKVYHILHEMAFPRRIVISKIEDRLEAYGNHILKCVVYKDTFGSLDYWCKEISGLLEYFDSLNTKDSKPLKSSVYNEIFDEYANETSDFKACLLGFRISEERKKEYPFYEIDNDLVSRFEDVYIEIKNKVCDMLSEKIDYTSADYFNTIKIIFNKYSIREISTNTMQRIKE